MSKHKLILSIQKELDILNHRIDRKILRGLSYSREAHQHRMLRNKLGGILRGQSMMNSGWISRAMNNLSASVSTLMF